MGESRRHRPDREEFLRKARSGFPRTKAKKVSRKGAPIRVTLQRIKIRGESSPSQQSGEKGSGYNHHLTKKDWGGREGFRGKTTWLGIEVAHCARVAWFIGIIVDAGENFAKERGLRGRSRGGVDS